MWQHWMGQARLAAWAAMWLCAAAWPMGPAAAQIAVKTYHNDSLRTGWNANERVLSVASVGGGTFALQHSVALDDQVDGQPLYVPKQSVSGQDAPHNVVYVATENNTVYAIDAATGTVLLSRHIGPPVPQSALPGQCNNNGPNVGIDSTPVLSTSLGAIWVIADTLENNQAVMRLHELDLGTLADKVPPATVSAHAKLADGSTFVFNPTTGRQRVALMYANNAIYAAFTSYCDMSGDITRGLLLRWNAGTLAPYATNELTNRSVNAPDGNYLSTIWMSGYGLATEADNDPIFFVTGNAGFSGETYNSVTNLAESIVEVSPNLATVQDHFTPSTETTLDQNDNDFGSGGVMALPTGTGTTPRLAVAAGKDGRMFLVDRTNLGGYTPGGPDHVLGTYTIGGCWCGPSYFTGADGVGRVVSSGGSNVIVWRLNSSGAATLTQESSSASLSTGQDGGFFTSVSSHGTQAGTAVIWAVSRPTDSNPANVILYALNGATGATIFSGVAGTWPNTSGNANIVPTVTGGQVFVASDKELAIFGLGTPASVGALAGIGLARQQSRADANRWEDLAADEHAVYGHVRSVIGTTILLQKRDGALVSVDLTKAARLDHGAVPTVGRATLVRGRYSAAGTLVADYVLHAKQASALWRLDQ